MSYNEMKIDTLGDYVSLVIKMNDVNKGISWYRGHANREWSLLPKIQRDFDVSEEEIFGYERFYTSFFHKGNMTTDIKIEDLKKFGNCLLQMKRNGLPTRLLEWCISPLTALYFAVSDKTEKKKDGCVWALKPEKLNIAEKLSEEPLIFDLFNETVLTMLYPAFEEIKDEQGNGKIEKQKLYQKIKVVRGKIASCYQLNDDNSVAYTVHNTIDKLTDICDESVLIKIVIPKNKKDSILKDLAICGIT